MNIQTLAPLCKGLRWRTWRTAWPGQTTVLSKTNKYVLINETNLKGWIWQIGLMFNDPLASWDLDFDNYRQEGFTPFILNSSGLVGFQDAAAGTQGNPGQPLWTVTRYDAVGSIYLVSYSPPNWWPIWKHMKLSLYQGPSSVFPAGTSMLLGANVELLEIEREDLFRESLADLGYTPRRVIP